MHVIVTYIIYVELKSNLPIKTCHEVSLEVLPSHIASDGLSRAICGLVPEQASSEAEQDENRRTGNGHSRSNNNLVVLNN